MQKQIKRSETSKVSSVEKKNSLVVTNVQQTTSQKNQEYGKDVSVQFVFGWETNYCLKM